MKSAQVESSSEHFADLSLGDQNAAVIGALRLAMAGAYDEDAELVLVRALVDQAPPTDDSDLDGPRLLVDTIRRLNGTYRVVAA